MTKPMKGTIRRGINIYDDNKKYEELKGERKRQIRKCNDSRPLEE